MQRSRSIIAVVVSLVLLTCIFVVGIYAASKANVSINATVSYSPSVYADVYVNTNDSTQSNYYYNGTTFVATSTTKVGSTETDIGGAISFSTNVFGMLTIYMQITNKSGFAIASDISVSGTGVSINSIKNVALATKDATAIAEVIVVVGSATDVNVSMDLVRADGQDGSMNFSTPSVYNIALNGVEVINKTATEQVFTNRTSLANITLFETISNLSSVHYYTIKANAALTLTITGAKVSVNNAAAVNSVSLANGSTYTIMVVS